MEIINDGRYNSRTVFTGAIDRDGYSRVALREIRAILSLRRRNIIYRLKSRMSRDLHAGIPCIPRGRRGGGNTTADARSRSRAREDLRREKLSRG